MRWTVYCLLLVVLSVPGCNTHLEPRPASTGQVVRAEAPPVPENDVPIQATACLDGADTTGADFGGAKVAGAEYLTVRQQLAAMKTARSEEGDLWRQCLSHARTYERLLGPPPERADLDAPQIVVGPYVLTWTRVCGVFYGGEWVDMWLAHGPGATIRGGGTTEISALDKEHFEHLVRLLEQELK